MQYKIPYENLSSFQKKLRTIENKCSQMGLDFSCTYGDICYEDRIVDIDQNTQKPIHAVVKLVEVDVDGTAIVDGYQFLAVIEHRKGGNLIKKIGDDELDPKWRTAEPKCEHCGTVKNRKNTYLVKNIETGEVKQLGKSCLKLYTNGLSAEHVATYESFIKMLYDYGCWGIENIPRGLSNYFPLVRVLALAIIAVDNFGYVKSGESGSTRSKVSDQLDKLKEPWTVTEEHIKRAKEMIDYVNSKEATSDYISNLQTILSDDYVEEKDFGFICSIPSMYNRDMAKEAEKKAREEVRAKEGEKSNWIGEVGEKLTATIVSFDVMATFENAYGYASLIKMVTDDGNQLKWTTGSFPNFGDLEYTSDAVHYRPMEFTDLLPCKIQFTVKSHDEYKGTKQTTILRVKPVKGEIEKKFKKVTVKAKYGMGEESYEYWKKI